MQKQTNKQTNPWVGRPGLDNEQKVVNRQPVYALWSGFYEKVQRGLARRICISLSSCKGLEVAQMNHVGKKILHEMPKLSLFSP